MSNKITEKVCKVCTLPKPSTEFPHYRRVCVPCRRIRQKLWRDNNKEKCKEYTRRWIVKNPQARKLAYKNWEDRNPHNKRNRALRRKYGITQELFELMVTAQKSLCAICQQPETKIGMTGKVVPLSVDHDHITGKTRQLLCGSCNFMIGCAKDNASLLRSAIEYLERHE